MVSKALETHPQHHHHCHQKKKKKKKIHKTKQLKLYDQEGKANRNLASIQQ